MPEPASNLFRLLPQLGEIAASEPFRGLEAHYGRELVAATLREALAQLRAELRAGTHTEASLQAHLAELPSEVARALQHKTQPSLRRVLNATGVLLQTNLGRAPLSGAALGRIARIASGYSNLEFDLDTGHRSRRDIHADQLILDVLSLRSGAPPTHRSAAVVNNCAAATFLALNTLAEGGEVIVSRGELVEIGGGFRIPEILQKSGATLREVGTTNRTRIVDYAAAITPQTRLILRVHRSNFRIEGFTAQPSLDELIELGQRASLPIFEDQGTGALIDLSDLGLPGESSWLRSATSPLALVAASGDKLLGGPQCGILVGDAALLERIRANPLFRALRVDKLTYAALEATLQAYLRGREANLPLVAMLRAPLESIHERCESLAAALADAQVTARVTKTESIIGGGTTPGASLPSYAVSLRHAHLSDAALATQLRHLRTPVIARTQEGQVLLDLRTIPSMHDRELTALLREALAPASSAASQTEPQP